MKSRPGLATIAAASGGVVLERNRPSNRHLDSRLQRREAFVGRRPKTTYPITVAGREALLNYLPTMQSPAEAVGLQNMEG